MSQSKEELIVEEKLGNNQIVIIDQVPTTPKERAAEKERKRKIRVGCMMSIAYASNIGGTGSQIGSSPQLALKGILQKSVYFPKLLLHDKVFHLFFDARSFGSATGLNFATWMAFNIPGMLINLMLAWLWIQLLFIGFRRYHNN
jgi:sodium-dependent dicarboxylate transporter 2/3/5